MRVPPTCALLALLALCVSPCIGGKRLQLGSAPWFCHDLDCPEFEVVESTDAYETREYEGGESGRGGRDWFVLVEDLSALIWFPCLLDALPSSRC